MLVTATIYVFYLAITTLEKINKNIIRLDNDIDIDSASSLNLPSVIVYLDLNSQMKDLQFVPCRRQMSGLWLSAKYCLK